MAEIRIKTKTLNAVYTELRLRVRKLNKQYKKSLDKKGNINWKEFSSEEMGRLYSYRHKLAFLEQLAKSKNSSNLNKIIG